MCACVWGGCVCVWGGCVCVCGEGVFVCVCIASCRALQRLCDCLYLFLGSWPELTRPVGCCGFS